MKPKLKLIGKSIKNHYIYIDLNANRGKKIYFICYDGKNFYKV